MFTLNPTETAIASIAIENNVIRAIAIQTDSNRSFINSTQLAAISSNTLSVSSLTNSVSDIEDVTDLITITQQHNLDNTKDTVGFIQTDANGITSLTVTSGRQVLTTAEVSDANQSKRFANVGQLTKVNHLSVTDATNLDDLRRKGGAISINAQYRITALDTSGSQVMPLDRLSDTAAYAKMTVGERTGKLNHILGNSVGISTFITNDGGSGESVNLYHLHNAFLPTNTSCTDTGVYSDSCSAIKAGSRLPDPDTDRSGQTGDKLIVIGDDGNYDEIDDGTKSQVLSTSGAGVLSFQSIKYPVAAVSGRVTTTAANNYYYGSSSFGWNYPIWSSISFNNTAGNPYARTVLDDYAHCGIAMPMRLQNLRVYGTVRNDSGTENIRLFLGTVAPPNGSSSSMTLTELGTQDITVSTQDRHYDVDFSTTGSVPAGNLVFIGIGRASTTTGTRYLNFSLSIQGTL